MVTFIRVIGIIVIMFIVPLGVKAETAEALFEKILIIGADISNNTKFKCPGYRLGERAGVGEDRILLMGRDYATSDGHLDWLRESLSNVKPSLVIAFDLFFHDFKKSGWYWKKDRKRVEEIVTRLATTAKEVYLGNTVPLGVYLGPVQVNRHLAEMAACRSNIYIVDLFKMFKDSILYGYFTYHADGKTFNVSPSDLIGEDKVPTEYGLQLMTNMLIETVRMRNPEITREQLPYYEVSNPKREVPNIGPNLLTLFDSSSAITRLTNLNGR